MLLLAFAGGALYLADAKKLNVTATLEFFVNGKPMPGFNYDQRKTPVEDAVSSAH